MQQVKSHLIALILSLFISFFLTKLVSCWQPFSLGPRSILLGAFFSDVCTYSYARWTFLHSKYICIACRSNGWLCDPVKSIKTIIVCKFHFPHFIHHRKVCSFNDIYYAPSKHYSSWTPLGISDIWNWHQSEQPACGLWVLPDLVRFYRICHILLVGRYAFPCAVLVDIYCPTKPHKLHIVLCRYRCLSVRCAFAYVNINFLCFCKHSRISHKYMCRLIHACDVHDL